jgi:putative transposase
MELTELKASVEHLRITYAFSKRRACRLLELAVSTFRYASCRSDDSLREKLVALARDKPRFGYRRLQLYLDTGDMAVNHMV